MAKMNQKSGKSLDQILQDLNNMISNLGGKKRNGGSAHGGSSHERSNSSNSGGIATFLIVLVFIGLYGAASSFYQIEPTQQGVVTRFGAYSQTTDEGPHFKLPFGIDQVYKIEVTRIHEEQFGFRKQGKQINTQQARQESLMLTGDLKVAIVEWIVQYKINDPKKYIFNAVNVSKNIRDISISVMRRVVGDKLVSDVLTTDRVSIASEAKRLTQETIDLFDMGITITNLNLQNVTPPESVRAAFNNVNIARQEKDQLINQAKGLYNKVIPEAEGKAGQVLANAEAFAIATVNKATGDAEKFRSILESYKQAPAITRKRLYIETMQEIFSQVKTLRVVDSNVKGVLPVYAPNGQTLPPPQKAGKTSNRTSH